MERKKERKDQIEVGVTGRSIRTLRGLEQDGFPETNTGHDDKRVLEERGNGRNPKTNLQSSLLQSPTEHILSWVRMG